MGISEPNALQRHAVPAILRGKNALLTSYTGSGKTLAALIPVAQSMLGRGDRGGAVAGTLSVDRRAPCSPRLLILAPTRELCSQITRVAVSLFGHGPVAPGAARWCVEEEDIARAIAADRLGAMLRVRKPELVALTPRDATVLAGRRALSLDRLEALFLDEVDLLVDSDARRVEQILDTIPDIKVVQKVLASATCLSHPKMPALLAKLHPGAKSQSELLDQWLDVGSTVANSASSAQPAPPILDQVETATTGAVRGGVGAISLPPTLTHVVVDVKNCDGEWSSTPKVPEAGQPAKLDALVELLLSEGRRGREDASTGTAKKRRAASVLPPQERRQQRIGSTLIFVSRKRETIRAVRERLIGSGINVHLLTPQRRQQQRNAVTWDLMQAGRPGGDNRGGVDGKEGGERTGLVVVATDDLAARGLDYEDVDLVIHFDLPFGVKNFAHRAGRAGRAGKPGAVVSLVSNAKERKFVVGNLLAKLGALGQAEQGKPQGVVELKCTFEELAQVAAVGSQPSQDAPAGALKVVEFVQRPPFDEDEMEID